MKQQRIWKDKKGIFFTIVVLVFLAVIFLVAMPSARIRYSDVQDLHESRIMTMDDFLDSFHSDSKRAIYISTFRALIALEDYVAFNGAFINDTEFYFKQLFYNGNISGDPYAFDIMNASTFRDYQRKVNEIANEVNLDFNTSVNDITLYMIDPWTIRVAVDIYVTLRDRTNLSRWDYNETIYSDVPIFDLRDPLYSVNTLGKFPVIVKKTNYSYFVNDAGDQNDTTFLQLHLNNSLYINSTLAPNFLMRFENNLEPDINGIESLVNLQVLSDQGWVIMNNNLSVVDYLYFGGNGTDNYCNIQNMRFPPEYWFILDRNHSEIYQINTTLDHDDC